MNQISWQIYGGEDRTPNTFIGGVASVITTSGALATKLGIASNRITNFKIVGSDIECRIKRSYVIPDNNWQNDSSLTYYQDNDGLVTSIGVVAFKAQTNYLTLYFPGITNGQIGTSIFQDHPNGFTLLLPNCTFIPNNFMGNVFPTSNETVLYIPRCTSIGSTELYNNCLEIDFCNGGLIYVPISKQTSNAGGVEGDLAFAIANNATVRYVTNFTAPNPITDLSTGTITSTTIQLNFTAPTGNTNVIDYYECYTNGVLQNIITASGQNVTGLITNTTYTIEVRPVDIFYNKSTSNLIEVTTL